MRMTEQERRIRIRHLKRMYRIRERKERHDKKVSGLFMKRVVFTLILGSTGQAKRNRSFTMTNIIIRMTNLRKECRW